MSRRERRASATGLRRALRAFGIIVGSTVTFALATAGGVVLHIGMPPARRLVTKTLNTALRSSFQGTLTIEQIDRLGLEGICAVRVTVRDAGGSPVLTLDGVRADISVVSAVASVVFGRGPIFVNVTRLRVQNVDAVLAQDSTGALTIQHAFDPRTPSLPDPKARALALSLPDIGLEHAWIHGTVSASAPPLDVELRRVSGTIHDDPKVMTIDLSRLDVEARGLPQRVDPRGQVEAHLRLPSKVAGQPLDASVSFVGWIAEQKTTLSGSIEGVTVTGLLDIPRIDPGTLKEVIAASPLQDAAALHVDAKGTLPDVAGTAHVVVGPGTVDVDASGRIEAVILANFKVVARGLDMHSFSPTGEHSDLSATTTASLRAKDGAIQGLIEMDSAVGVVSGQVLPHAKFIGRFTEDSIAGHARIDEVGAPTEVDLDVHPLDGPGSANVVDFETSVDAPELGRVPRLAHAATGAAHAHARGRLIVPGSRVSVRAEAEVQHVTAAGGELHISSGNLGAAVQGPMAGLALDVHVRGSGLALGGHVFRTFDVKTQGTQRDAHVLATLVGENTPDVHLDAHVHPGGTTTIDRVELALSRKDVNVLAHVDHMSVGGGATKLEGVSVEGLGAKPVLADVTLRPRALVVKAKGGDVDLGRVGRLLDMEDTLQEGHVAFDVDVTSIGRGAKGKVNIELSGGRFPNVDAASGKLEASLDGRHLKSHLRGAAGDLGSIAVTADDIVLGGELLDMSSWRSAVGHAEVDTDFDLGKVASTIPRDRLPLEEAGGRVKLKVKLGRDRATELPDVDAEVATLGLVIVARARHPKGDGTDVRPSPPVQDTDAPTAPPFQSHGTDVEFAMHVKGKTNETTVAARLLDSKGILVQLGGEGAPPYLRMWKDRSHALLDIQNVPLKVQVVLPTRSLSDFPEFARVQGLHGALAGAIKVDGTMLAPRADLKVRAFGIEASDSSHATPVNIDVEAGYENDKVNVVAKVARPEAFVVHVDAGARVHMADLLESTGGPLAWDANGAVRFVDFPMDTLPIIAANRVHGNLTGTVTLDGLHRDAKLDVKLGLAKVRVGEVRYKDGAINAHAENGALTAGVRLDQSDGFAETHLSAGITWGGAVAPAVDETKSLEGTLKAQAFRLAVAQPFLGEAVNELDGRLDSDTKLTYDFGSKNGKVVGAINLRDGIFEIPDAGGEFHAVRARVTMNPFGTVRVDDVSANGATGRLAASATVKLDGLHFRAADGTIHITKSEKVPIEVGGVPMGTAWGDIAIKARMSPDGHDLSADVTLPKLYVDLPQSTGHTVQALEPNPDVTVGFREHNARFAVVELVEPSKPRPPSAMHANVALHFGDEVWVARGTMLKVKLHGGPVVDITDKVHLTGQITAHPGTIEVQSKKFELDNSSVSFVNDDPGNPQIVASAHWQAPSKTTVFVDVTGTPESLKIGFRADPDLPKDAILSLVLFGDENGSLGASPSGTSGDNEDVNEAAGLAAGVVTQGINKAISGVTSIDLTTRFDTSESQNPRPELAVQVTKNVSATVAYNLGLPPPGQNPDRTQVILDYRFVRNWSLLTTFGDAGSSILDLLWQYRY
jgi:translocation and assembly module TamB